MVVACLVVSAALLFSGLRPDHGWGGDFAGYVMQAASVVDGETDRYVAYGGWLMESSSRRLGPDAYPWGFPLLIAPAYALFGLDLVALKTVGAASYLLFLIALWIGFRPRHSDWWRAALVAVFAFNPYLLSFTNQLLSDLPFLLLSTVGLLLIGRIVIERRPLTSPATDRIALGLVLAAACLVRTPGYVLLVALASAQLVAWWRGSRGRASVRTLGADHGTGGDADQVHRTGDHPAVALLPYAVCLAAVATAGWLLPGGGLSYVDLLQEVSATSVRRNVIYYSYLPARFFIGVPHVEVLVYAATLPLALAGAIRRRRADVPILVYAAATLAIVIVWPERQSLRFLFPLLPFYVSYTLAGLDLAIRHAPGDDRPIRRVAAVLPVALLILVFAHQSIVGLRLNLGTRDTSVSGPYLPPARDLFERARERIPDGAVTAFFKPRVFTLYTGHRALMLDRPEQLPHADFLCYYLGEDAYDQITGTQLAAERSAGRIVLLYSNELFELYRVR